MTEVQPKARGSGLGPHYDSGIARALREWRQASGLSQIDVAGMIGDGCSQSEVSHLERGWILAPRYERMAAFARAMDRPLDDLLRETRWAGPYGEGPNVAALDLWTVSDDALRDLNAVAVKLSRADVATLVRIARVLAIDRGVDL